MNTTCWQRIAPNCLLMAALIGANVSAQDTDDIEPGVDTSAVTDAVSSQPAPRTLDAIELDSTQITGNQELPQVLYIVPWKSSDLGDLVGRPVNTLLDEVLEPADREVFVRQIRYYEDLNSSEESP